MLPTALSDLATIGVSLPHRWTAPPRDLASLTDVARQAERLGFADVWVTENTTDHVHCLDPVVALSHASAMTAQVRLGVAVALLPLHQPVRLAHQWASLDAMSGGRAILGVGLGRPEHHAAFGIPADRRVRRFLDAVTAVRRLWREQEVTLDSEFVRLDAVRIGLRPARPEGPPIWFGGMHPDAVRRAARHADGWIASGHSGHDAFAATARLMREELDRTGRDVTRFPVSKRVFLAVDDSPAKARAALRDWFAGAYRDADLAATSGVAGRPSEVAERLAELVDAGASHLLLNPVADHAAQVDALAEAVGLARRARPR